MMPLKWTQVDDDLTLADENTSVTQSEQPGTSTEYVNGEETKKIIKTKLSKKGAAMEMVVGGIIDKFMKQQEEAEGRFLSFEEKMRKEEREHEERMMRMMMSMLHSPTMPVVPSPNTYYYNSPQFNYRQQREGMPPDGGPLFDDQNM